jgi:DDE superfamily endonuclease
VHAIEKYNIPPDRIYNWDEKGFLIGIANSMKRVMSKEAFKSGRVTNARTDGSREFISLLACICADGSFLPPALIYKGASHDLNDSWLEDVGEDTVYFAATENGWTCDDLGIDWLMRVFERHTKHKSGRRMYRLLLVDGHSSHVNMRFLDLAYELRILVLSLPAHSTHRLQPLDVNIFGPLSTAYSKALERLMHKGAGLVSMTKRLFWPLFNEAWTEAFTMERILHAFEKPGIWPPDPEKVLGILQKPAIPTTPVQASTELVPLQIPITCRAIRQAHRAYQLELDQAKLEKLMNANIQLAAQQSINEHVISGLQYALAIEKKKRTRGKKLNLIGEQDSKAQFWSPTRYKAAQAYQAQKEEAEHQRKEAIASKKACAAAAREQKQAQRNIAILQRTIARQVAQEEKARKEAERAQARKERIALLEQRRADRLTVSSPKKGRLPTRSSSLPPEQQKVGIEGKEMPVVVRRTIRGRQVIVPRRFNL